MNNCIVNTLKADTNNNNLLKIGVMTINFKASENPSASNNVIYIRISDDVEVNSVKLKVVSGDARICLSVPSNWNDHSAGVEERNVGRYGVNTFYLTNADCVLELSNKYEVTYISPSSIMGLNIDELFLPKLTQINATFEKGEMLSNVNSWPNIMTAVAIKAASSDYVKSNMAYYLADKDIMEYNLNGNTSGISIEELLRGNTDLRVFGVPNSNISGSLSYFLNNGQKKYASLTTINVGNTPNITKNSADVTALRNLGVTVNIS